MYLWPFIKEARQNGAKKSLLTHPHRTAKAADWHLPVRPGTDGAFALGLMHVIINENLMPTMSKSTQLATELKERSASFRQSGLLKSTGFQRKT